MNITRSEGGLKHNDFARLAISNRLHPVGAAACAVIGGDRPVLPIPNLDSASCRGRDHVIMVFGARVMFGGPYRSSTLPRSRFVLAGEPKALSLI